MKNKNLSLRNIALFVMVGGFATGVQYVCMFILITVWNSPPVVASGIGFTISAVANYLLNARLTFRSTKSHQETVPRFIVTAAAGLAVNSAVFALLLHFGMHPAPAQVIATIFVLLWNFLVNALWTFRQPTP